MSAEVQQSLSVNPKALLQRLQQCVSATTWQQYCALLNGFVTGKVQRGQFDSWTMTAFRSDAKSNGMTNAVTDANQKAKQIHDQYMSLLCRSGPAMSTMSNPTTSGSNHSNGYVPTGTIESDGTHIKAVRAGASPQGTRQLSLATNPSLDSTGAASLQMRGMDTGQRHMMRPGLDQQWGSPGLGMLHEQFPSPLMKSPPIASPPYAGTHHAAVKSTKKDDMFLQHVYNMGSGSASATMRRQQEHQQHQQQQQQQPTAKRRKTTAATAAAAAAAAAAKAAAIPNGMHTFQQQQHAMAAAMNAAAMKQTKSQLENAQRQQAGMMWQQQQQQQQQQFVNGDLNSKISEAYMRAQQHQQSMNGKPGMSSAAAAAPAPGGGYQQQQLQQQQHGRTSIDGHHPDAAKVGGVYVPEGAQGSNDIELLQADGSRAFTLLGCVLPPPASVSGNSPKAANAANNEMRSKVLVAAQARGLPEECSLRSRMGEIAMSQGLSDGVSADCVRLMQGAMKHFIRSLLTRSIASARLQKSNQMSLQLQRQVLFLRQQRAAECTIDETQNPSISGLRLAGPTFVAAAASKASVPAGKHGQHGGGGKEGFWPPAAAHQRLDVNLKDVSFVATMGSFGGAGGGVASGRILGPEHEMHVDRMSFLD